ncbi:MAG: hypothetical protein AAF843_01645 [Bacteroidota bacterium]
MSITIILLYIVLPLIVLGGVMMLIRRKREKELNREPSNKVADIKAENVRKQNSIH